MFANTLIGFGTDLFTYSLALITSIVVARPLGPAGRGVFAIITIFNQYWVSLVLMGMGSVAEIQLAKKEHSLRAVHSFALFFSAFVGVISLVLFLILRSWLLGMFFSHIDERFAVVSVLMIPLVLYSILVNKILIGMNEIPALNVFKVIKSIFDLTSFTLLLLVIPLGLTGGVMTWVLSLALMALIQGVWLLKLSGWRLELNRRIIQESFSFGWKVQFAFLPAVAIAQMDSFALNYFHGAEQVGFYTIANNAVFRMSLLFGSVLTATQAKIIGHARQDSEQLIRRLIRHSAFLAGIIALILCFTGRYLIVWFYGKPFALSADALSILSFGMIAVTTANFFNIYAVGQLKKPALSALIHWGNFFLGLILYFLLIPRFGLRGTAFASVLISIAKVAGYLWLLGWCSRKSLSETFLLQREDFAFWKQKIRSFRENFAANLLR